MGWIASRRRFLGTAAIGALGLWGGARLRWLVPAHADERQLPLRVLTPKQARCLEAFADTLLPGSAKAGVAHFVDLQLALPLHEQMLLVRYLGVEPPFPAFYAGGLAALDALVTRERGRKFADLAIDDRVAFVGRLAQENPGGWAGPPAPLFYFTVRGDALDVLYGTREGIESLGIPYMAHIEPPRLLE
jgi:hypothetical protein